MLHITRGIARSQPPDAQPLDRSIRAAHVLLFPYTTWGGGPPQPHPLPRFFSSARFVLSFIPTLLPLTTQPSCRRRCPRQSTGCRHSSSTKTRRMPSSASTSPDPRTTATSPDSCGLPGSPSPCAAAPPSGGGRPGSHPHELDTSPRPSRRAPATLRAPPRAAARCSHGAASSASSRYWPLRRSTATCV